MIEIPVLQAPPVPSWTAPPPKAARRKTRTVRIADVPVGGEAPISVQTMTKTRTSDVDATVAQIVDAAAAGCDIVRVTVNDREAAEAMCDIVRRSPIPVIADIHFNHVFALESIKAGVAKVRLNPGNIGSVDRIREVLDAARARRIPIRIGVNSGSLEEDILDKHGYPTAEALFESAMRHVRICEEADFNDIIISVKSTDVRLMVEAYRYIAERTDYPLHLGVTEAGTTKVGTIKSAVGIGTLLAEGIGDTIRVSLTDEPVREVDLFRITNELEDRLKGIKKPVKIALLGCVVNGPGEASEADIGIAAGRGVGILYRRGEVVRRLREDEIIDAVVAEVEAFEPDEGTSNTA
jgi:(E)-4-hydroxy-3-methylbut-2-enyl-diphosphate synthase